MAGDLAIIVAGGDVARLHASLSLACAAMAGGRRVMIFCHAEAVAMLVPDAALAGDAARRTAGVPTVAELIETALDLGAAITVCQSGLALTGLSFSALDRRIEAGGLVGFLAEAGDATLLLG